jgi:hypothetical protein
MSRLVALVQLLLLFAATAAAGPGSATIAPSNSGAETKVFSSAEPEEAKSLECATCKVVAEELVGIGENATDIAKTIEFLQGNCNATLSNHSVERSICDAIVKGLVELLPFVDNEMAQLAWDSDNLCAVAGLCKVNCCVGANATTPEQVHLSLAADPSDMNVMWTTLNDTATHIVRWGTDPDQLNNTSPTANGSSATYTHFGWVGHLHRARMTGLAPGTQYYYAVGQVDGAFGFVWWLVNPRARLCDCDGARVVDHNLRSILRRHTTNPPRCLMITSGDCCLRPWLVPLSAQLSILL